jgi:hypothetical protein
MSPDYLTLQHGFDRFQLPSFVMDVRVLRNANRFVVVFAHVCKRGARTARANVFRLAISSAEPRTAISPCEGLSAFRRSMAAIAA